MLFIVQNAVQKIEKCLVLPIILCFLSFPFSIESIGIEYWNNRPNSVRITTYRLFLILQRSNFFFSIKIDLYKNHIFLF